MADAADSKSAGAQAPCRFESDLGHQEQSNYWLASPVESDVGHQAGRVESDLGHHGCKMNTTLNEVGFPA